LRLQIKESEIRDKISHLDENERMDITADVMKKICGECISIPREI